MRLAVVVQQLWLAELAAALEAVGELQQHME